MSSENTYPIFMYIDDGTEDILFQGYFSLTRYTLTVNLCNNELYADSYKKINVDNVKFGHIFEAELHLKPV